MQTSTLLRLMSDAIRRCDNVANFAYVDGQMAKVFTWALQVQENCKLKLLEEHAELTGSYAALQEYEKRIGRRASEV